MKYWAFFVVFCVFAKAKARNVIRHLLTSCLELRIDVEIANTAQKFINRVKAKLWRLA
jgi:hypothetical protein